MKLLKLVGQLFASILYTNIFTSVLYTIIIHVISAILSISSLDTIGIFIIAFLLSLCFGLLQMLVIGIRTIIMLPYLWIVKDNVVAGILSILLIIVNLSYNIYAVWTLSESNDTIMLILLNIIITIIIIESIITALNFIIVTMLKSHEKC